MTSKSNATTIGSAGHRSSGNVRCQMRAIALGAATALMVILAAPATSLAEAPCSDTFVGANNAKWSAAANWNTGHVPSSEDVVCIPAGVTASLFYERETQSLVSVREIHGGSLTTNAELHFTAQPSEGPDTLETLTVIGTTLAVEGPDELAISHELFFNGDSSLTGHGTIVLESGAVGEIGEVGCGTLYIKNTKLLNRGTLNIGRRYVGGVIVGLANEAQITNESSLAIDTQGSVSEHCPLETHGATIYLYSPTSPYADEALINRGTIQTEWGTSAASVSVPVTNDGTIIAHEGALGFTDGSVPTECSTGSWVSSGAQLSLTSGTFNIAPSVSLGGVQVTGATISGCPTPSSGSSDGSGASGSSDGASGSGKTEGSESSPMTVSLGSSESATNTGESSSDRGETGGERCVVPKLHVGASLKSVRRLLDSRHCQLGRVYRVRSRRVGPGRVLALKSHADDRLRAGAPVAVVVAETTKRHVTR